MAQIPNGCRDPKGMQGSQSTAHSGLGDDPSSASSTFLLPPGPCSFPARSILTLRDILTLFSCPVFRGHPR